MSHRADNGERSRSTPGIQSVDACFLCGAPAAGGAGAFVAIRAHCAALSAPSATAVSTGTKHASVHQKPHRVLTHADDSGPVILGCYGAKAKRSPVEQRVGQPMHTCSQACLPSCLGHHRLLPRHRRCRLLPRRCRCTGDGRQAASANGPPSPARGPASTRMNRRGIRFVNAVCKPSNGIVTSK